MRFFSSGSKRGFAAAKGEVCLKSYGNAFLRSIDPTLASNVFPLLFVFSSVNINYFAPFLIRIDMIFV